MRLRSIRLQPTSTSVAAIAACGKLPRAARRRPGCRRAECRPKAPRAARAGVVIERRCRLNEPETTAEKKLLIPLASPWPMSPGWRRRAGRSSSASAREIDTTSLEAETATAKAVGSSMPGRGRNWHRQRGGRCAGSARRSRPTRHPAIDQRLASSAPPGSPRVGMRRPDPQLRSRNVASPRDRHRGPGDSIEPEHEIPQDSEELAGVLETGILRNPLDLMGDDQIPDAGRNRRRPNGR